MQRNATQCNGSGRRGGGLARLTYQYIWSRICRYAALLRAPPVGFFAEDADAALRKDGMRGEGKRGGVIGQMVDLDCRVGGR